MSITGMHVNEPHYTFILDKEHTKLLQVKSPKGDVMKIENAGIDNNITPAGLDAIKGYIQGEVDKLQRQKDEKDKELAEAEAKKKAEEEAEENSKAPRKKTREKSIEMDTVPTVAYQILKKYPNKHYSKSKLADAIAADERITVSASRVRQAYIAELLADKKHPVHTCYDQGNNSYTYRSTK